MNKNITENNKALLENYKALGLYIAEDAITSYEKALRKVKKNPNDTKALHELSENLNFIKSDTFDLYACGLITAEKALKEIHDRVMG